MFERCAVPVEVVDHETFEAFLDDLRNRPGVRLVKLADYGFVSPLRTSSGAIVMAPQVKVVATAVDKDARPPKLVRWQSSRRASGTVTVGIGTAKGIHGDMDVVAKKEDLAKWLELEGFLVSEGEWTPEEVNRLLAAAAR
jgi:hypothetical protein